MRDQTDAVVKRIQPQIDAVSSYARNEPTKAMLMSAAAGAALMGSSPSWSARRPRLRGRLRASSGQRTLSAIREAALDLADRAHSVAPRRSIHPQACRSALGAGERRRHRARLRRAEAAESVSDTVAEAWESLRDQAAPVVDQLRPQLEAPANYAKDEPARAALGIAAAGAVLIGLIACSALDSG